MNINKDISVIIPVFNAADFVIDTLRSVASQTILPYEIIVIDDGSTDDTCSIINEFNDSNEYLNLMLLQGEHRGAGAARNKGIYASTGRWIAFLDSDDLWMPDKLEKIGSALAMTANFNFISNNEIHRSIGKVDKVVDYSRGYFTDRPLPPQLFSKNMFSTSAVVCQRDLLVSYNGFDESFPNGQDYELWLRMSPSIKVLFVPETLGVYVERLGNISSGHIWRRLVNTIKVLNRHKEKVSRLLFYRTISRTLLSYLRHVPIK